MVWYHWLFGNSFNEVVNAKHTSNDKLNRLKFTDDRFDRSIHLKSSKMAILLYYQLYIQA